MQDYIFVKKQISNIFNDNNGYGNECNGDIEIGAAILEQDLASIKNKIDLAKDVVDFIQIDICDGNFVKSKTYLHSGDMNDAISIKESVPDDVILELDMMTDWLSGVNWTTIIHTIRPHRAVLHYKSINDNKLFELFSLSEFESVSFGLGVGLDDDLERVIERLKRFPFAYAQIMGIEKIGYGGQNQSPKLVPVLQAISRYCTNLPLCVDGGVKLENVRTIQSAGAVRFAIGSGLFFASDLKQRAREFRRVLNCK